MIAVANDSQFGCLCEILGVPELSSDTRFATNPSRVLNRKALLDILTEKIPAGPISDLAEVFDNAQIQHRGMRVGVRDDSILGGAVDLLRLPILFSGAGVAPMRTAPRLGEHTEEILREIGMGR